MRLAGHDQARLIGILGDIIPALVRREVPPREGDSKGRCIIASRVGHDALRYFEIPVKPVVLSVIAANREWLTWREKWDSPETQLEAGPMPDDAWSVAVGFGQGGPGGFDAHLALAVGDEGYLLCDFDAGQLSRPQHRMVVPPSVIVPWDGKNAWVDLDDGAAIAYGSHVFGLDGLGDYRKAPDWTKTKPLSGMVIRQARDRLNSMTPTN